MNEQLKARIVRALERLGDERGYQVLDYVEFLESRYAERARPDNLLARLTDTVTDTMRAAKLPVQAIATTTGLVDSAARVMRGVAAAGQAIVEEAVRAAAPPAPATPAPPDTPAALPPGPPSSP